MVAIYARVSKRLKFGVLERYFCKALVWCDFGHFIHDSNKYRFIYVPRNISTEKKNIFHERFGFIFFSRETAGQQFN